MTSRKTVNELIVCGSHWGLEDLAKGWYPSVYDGDPGEALRLGWERTNHRLFSYAGNSVWICPECARRLDRYRVRNGEFFVWQRGALPGPPGALPDEFRTRRDDGIEWVGGIMTRRW